MSSQAKRRLKKRKMQKTCPNPAPDLVEISLSVYEQEERLIRKTKGKTSQQNPAL
jgi:hypothetical protein